MARDSDDILITSGCQQAFDLLQRTAGAQRRDGAVEDPVYPGVKNVFERAGARLVGVPVGPNGIDLEALERVDRRASGRACCASRRISRIRPARPCRWPRARLCCESRKQRA